MAHTDQRIRQALETLDPIRAEPGLGGEEEVESALDRLKRSEGWSELPSRRVEADRPGVPKTRPGSPRLRPRWRRRKLVPIAATMLSLVLLAALALRPDTDPARESLNQAMASVAAVAAKQPAAPIKAGEFRFLRTITAYRDTAVSGGVAWMTTRPTLMERWVDASGSGRERIAEGGRQFASSADHRVWQQAGAPNIGEIDGPLKTNVRELTGSDARHVLDIPIKGVPTDPAGLRSLVERTAQQANGSAPEAAKAVELIGDLLRDPATSGAVRRAAYLALAEIEGVAYLGSRPDPLGRPGEAVGVISDYSGGNTEYALVYSPATGQPLAFTYRLVASSKDSESEAYLGAEVYVAQGRTASSQTLPDGVEALGNRRIELLLEGILNGAGMVEDSG